MLAMLSIDLETLPVNARAIVTAHLVETLVAANLEHAKLGKLPPLHDSSVRYAPSILWQDAPAIVRATTGDCKGLSAWRIAELRQSGVDARVHVEVNVLDGRDELHVKIRLPKGFEDPSVDLGMNAFDDQQR